MTDELRNAQLAHELLEQTLATPNLDPALVGASRASVSVTANPAAFDSILYGDPVSASARRLPTGLEDARPSLLERAEPWIYVGSAALGLACGIIIGQAIR